MTTESKRGAKQPDKSQIEREFTRIKEGLKTNQARIAESLRQRVGTGDWKISEIDCLLDEGKEKLDIIFSAPDGKKQKYIIVDISIPHLGIGQKYGLPGKAKLFQKEREVSALRIKKAIILIRKGTESVSTQPGRIRCPIIEVQLESIVKPEPVVEKPVERPVRDTRDERAPRDNRDAREPRDNRDAREPRDNRDNRGTRGPNRNERQPRNERPAVAAGENERPAEQPQVKVIDNRPGTGIAGVSQDLLFALKEAIVHECLSTMHKRCNKYVRKGLWRWIEREIMDPNVHFYLIILSSIYQGKTGEILSRRFKFVEDYSSKPEDVISAIFSRENNLADEIKKDSERHRRALTKFLVCFNQTPPFEYLKSVFLKDFRSFNDGLKARMSVYTTLEQLLERCGFDGEKETRYPLEILDELKIFQGIMTGNYACLRTDNAAKKLKHLVPQVEWSNEDIYSLRNQLAKALNLPAQEFNLNAFLPQAFFQDAKILAETRKEAIRLPAQPRGQQAAPAPERPAAPSVPLETASPDDQAEENPRQSDPRNNRRDRKNDFFEKRKAEKLARQQQRGPRPLHPDNDARSELPARHEPERNEPERREAAEEPARPISARALINNNQSPEPQQDNGLNREPRLHSLEVDESQHRYFENFGGHLEEDTDAIRLALAMVRHDQEKAEQKAARIATAPVTEDFGDDSEQEDLYRPPLKAGPGRAPINMNPPPRRPAPRQPGPDGQPARPDRKRRFTRSNSQSRNKPRRPGTPGSGGVNR